MEAIDFRVAGSRSYTSSLTVLLQDKSATGLLSGQSPCGKIAVKVDPLPVSLSSERVPPIKLTRPRQIASPSPLPSTEWTVVLSTRLNSLKSSACLLFGIPIPVSLTERCTMAVSPTRDADSSRTTPPSPVNFTAFPKRLMSSCFIRMVSPTRTEGTSGSMVTVKESSFSFMRTLIKLITSCRRSITLYGSLTRVIFFASMREKSRISFITESSSEADERTWAT